MGPLNPPRPELIVGLICFFSVVGVFAKLLVPRIQKTLTEREDAIEGTIGRAEAIHDEARRIYAEYQAELSAARHEAAQVRQTAKEEGAALLATLRAEGQKQREHLVAAAKTQLEADRIIAEAELREDVFTLATELAGRIVGEPLNDLPRARVIADDFFTKVDVEISTKK
ncbi:F0F1 ATP synthase subunit B [Streptomyces sp. NPDC046197]|uniref:F0F1 ATP synthase subunit B n=1 Tax=Streptomyces sp. NPDC046197 TaxID=3154337 RepID=UPI0033C1E1DE